MVIQTNESSPKRGIKEYRIIIEALPKNIFPLFCPVREEEWIYGWNKDSYDLIYSKSGVNEKNVVFQEKFTRPFLFGEEGPTTWVTTYYEPGEFSLEFLLIFGDVALLNRAIRLEQTEAGTTDCRWIDTFTLLQEPFEGTQRENFEMKLDAFSGFLQRTLKHYCETGNVLEIDFSP